MAHKPAGWGSPDWGLNEPPIDLDYHSAEYEPDWDEAANDDDTGEPCINHVWSEPIFTRGSDELRVYCERCGEERVTYLEP